MNDDWIAFKKSFTKEQEEGLWQYFIDHSQVQPNGYLGVQFYVEDVNDFWKRVYARVSGDFKRYEAQDKVTRQAKYRMHYNDFLELQIVRRKGEKISDVCEEIDGGRNPWRKFLLWLYRHTREHLF